MEAMIKEYLKSLLRTLAVPAIVWLSSKGWVSESEATQFITAAVVVVIGIVWGLVNKYLWKKSAERALEHPATDNTRVLNDIINNPKPS